MRFGNGYFQDRRTLAGATATCMGFLPYVGLPAVRAYSSTDSHNSSSPLQMADPATGVRNRGRTQRGHS